MAEFKFFRHQSGVSSFAALALEPCTNRAGDVVWVESLRGFEPVYGDAIRAGIRDALHWHSDQGGREIGFRICRLIELLVDTTPDAMRCAATGAAWIALGDDIRELTFEFHAGWAAKRILR